VQPFIAIKQVLALALLLERQSLSPKLVIDLAISMPVLFAGSVLGIVAFRISTRPGFAGPFLCYCCCQALRSLWFDNVIAAEACEALEIQEHWPKES
jgi:ABC-type molybdate transport system permease subunit